MRATRVALVLAVGAAPAGLALPSCTPSSASTTTGSASPHVVGKSKEDIGKYIMQIAGCHDCHTPGVMQGKLAKDIPESEWFTGSPLGYSGPWGTSYAPNLRLKIGPFNEAMFIATMRKRNERPPMPWAALHAMTDEDLGAVFSYVKSLGPAGTAMPEPLPPGNQPPQPFIVMVPDMGGAPATAPATQK